MSLPLLGAGKTTTAPGIPAAYAYYTFDASVNGAGAADATGNGYALATPVSTTYGTPAKLGAKAMTGGQAQVVIDTLTTWTVTAWMRTGTTGFDGFGSLLSDVVNGTYIAQVEGPPSGPNQLSFGGGELYSSGLSDNTYYHIAVVGSAAPAAVYLNGVYLGDVSVLAPLDSISLDLRYDVATPIDEVGVWDVALTAPQIAALASGQRPPNVGA